MMGNKVKVDLEKAIEAAHTGRGILSSVAKNLGVSRSTVQNYRKRWITFDEAMIEARATTVDFAESQLFKLIEEGDRTAIIFTLKTLGADRGYIETHHKRIITDELDKVLEKIKSALDDTTYQKVLAAIADV